MGIHDHKSDQAMSEELRESGRLIEWEILRRTQPSWLLARNEPFIQNPQDDVTPPAWDGVEIQERENQQTGGDQSTGTYRTWNVIVNGQAGYADFDSSVGRLTPSP